MVNKLSSKKCIPCEREGVEPLDEGRVKELTAELLDWSVSSGADRLKKEYVFADFIQAIEFVNQVADLAESEGHHPDISIHYNKVVIELWTHSAKGLTENDFILASKIDEYIPVETFRH